MPPMLPHMILADLFDEDWVDNLLDHVGAHEADFVPTAIAEGSRIDATIRVSTKLHDLGPFAASIRTVLLDRLPQFGAGLGIRPIAQPRIEMELVAHGDGAFFKRHIDTMTAPKRAMDPSIRIVSGVYYFHARPKRFSGGALRLHGFGAANGGDFIDVEPIRNSLVAFPSWAPHEVRPVGCPSRRFIDSRFAINCWIHERLPAGP